MLIKTERITLDEGDILGGLIVMVILILFTIGLYFTFFAERPHQGYYLYVLDAGKMPEYRIYNNWKNFPDDTAYVTSDKEEVLKVFKELQP